MNEPEPRAYASSSRTPSALPLGTRLGEFELKRVLGVGGFGIVYLAFDHLLEREVAVKEYMPQQLVDRTATMQVSLRSSSDADTFAMGLRSFVNEARLLAHFNHPSLLKVHRFWEANGTAYMAMPMYRGRTLKEVADALGQAPSEAWLRHVLVPLLGALELMHREGVYHRDISPDNILIEDDGNPVLLDFGAARRVIADRSQNLTAILKPSYAPIEQYAETSAIKQGPWTDIYALGATLHFLLLGKPPPPSTTRSIHDEMVQLSQQRLPGIGAAFLATVDWMLVPRPADRAPSVAALRDALEGRIVPPTDTDSTVPVRPADRGPLPMPADDEAPEDATTTTRPLSDSLPPTQFAPRNPDEATVRVTAKQAPRTVQQGPQRTTQPTTQPLSRTAPPAAAVAIAAASGLANGDDETTVLVARQPRPMPVTRTRQRSRSAGWRVPLMLGVGIGGAAVLLATLWWTLQRPANKPGAASPMAAASAASAVVAAVPAASVQQMPAVQPNSAPLAGAASDAAPASKPVAAGMAGVPGAVGSAPARSAVAAASAPKPRPSSVAARTAPPVTTAASSPPAAAPAIVAAPPTASARPAPLPAPTVNTAPPTPAVAGSAGDSPRARCANLNFLDRFMCMRRECSQAQWREHPECAQWRPDSPPGSPDSR